MVVVVVWVVVWVDTSEGGMLTTGGSSATSTVTCTICQLLPSGKTLRPVAVTFTA